jgi:hypothetical protein
MDKNNERRPNLDDLIEKGSRVVVSAPLDPPPPPNTPSASANTPAPAPAVGADKS